MNNIFKELEKTLSENVKFLDENKKLIKSVCLLIT